MWKILKHIFFYLYGVLFDAVIVFCLGFDFLFKFIVIPCDGVTNDVEGKFRLTNDLLKMEKSDILRQNTFQRSGNVSVSFNFLMS